MSDAPRDTILLGYDLRAWTGPEVGPSPVQAAAPRVRREVERVLSIDRQVWPSLFEQPGVEEPAYTGLYVGLWAERRRMEAQADACCGTSRGAAWTPAAFAVVTRSCHRIGPRQWRRWSADVDPPGLGDDWSFLGYDVADKDAVSALLTLQLPRDPEERARLARRLNRWHLFDRYDPAEEMAQAADRAVPDHAPFFVYAVWVPADRD